MIFDDPRQENIDKHLFATPGHHAYAVVDGAALPGLLPRLYNYPADYCCLFRGELLPELAAMAPYLIKLEQYTPITEWLLNSKDSHPGIFSVIPDALDFNAVHTHFRRFLRVSGPDNQALYFRYYDPRVMSEYLPSCPPQQARTVFGPVQYYLLEDPEQHTRLYWVGSDGVGHRSLMPVAESTSSLAPESKREKVTC